jgi:hypothetical protein
VGAGDTSTAAKDSNTFDTTSQSNDANQSTMSIVGYGDDISTIANDTVNETTKAFFTGNGDRKDSKPRIRLFKEYKDGFKTPEKKKRSNGIVDDDEETQPETPPPMIQVPSGSTSHRSSSSHNKKGEGLAEGKDKSFFLRSKRVYILAGGLAFILFVSIIALAVALKGVRTEETSSAIESSPENAGNVILDLWPDLDTTITTKDEIETPIEIEQPIEDENPIENENPIEKEPVPTTAKPTLSPTAPPTFKTPDPTSEPTVDPAKLNFAEASDLLVEREAISSIREIERNPDSVQSLATTWLSQDPNFNEYNQDRLVQRWSLAVIAQSLDANKVLRNSMNLRRLQGGSDSLPGWLTYADECTWFTSSTEASPCDKDGMYQTMHLQDMMLGGTLPSELSLLSDSLRKFSFHLSCLTSATRWVPPVFRMCLDLTCTTYIFLNINIESVAEHVNLDGNDLTGSIPKELEDLTNLGTLYETDLLRDCGWNSTRLKWKEIFHCILLTFVASN